MKPDDQRALWRALHDASTRLAEEQTERWHEIANAIAAGNGSLNPNAWFVAACRRIAELEAQVADLEAKLRLANGAVTTQRQRIAYLEGPYGPGAQVAEARTRIAYAAESSTVTTSDNPGCFWCDHEEHTEKCWVPRWLRRTAPKEST